jgi:hypothetical protein
MSTLNLSIIFFISMFALTLAVKWLLKKYPGIICRVTAKHKPGSVYVYKTAIGENDWFTKCERCNHVTGPVKDKTSRQANKPRQNGGVRVTFYFNARDVESFPCSGQVPEEKPKTKFEKLQRIIDRTPGKWLQYQLDTALYNENFELAAYIRDVARKRAVKLEVKK